ncbi:preprotein translocase subunit SecF [Monaibacterium marinum]|uniref:Protein-export membrane protein SecF n=1 Tax=Pontivivens marinum TaxID=1690039 RepID=A0A2C9CQK0_9RHOB|nr:protein translocase subunit SecF [Monaibacterium marinum]SOH93487.1 preprotein translocase subunit SecF [Monaibacterium marinum]
MRLKLIPDSTKFDFFKLQTLSFGISTLAVIASIVLFAMVGLNYGIDFRGGSVIMTETPGPVATQDYRDLLGELEVGDATVSQISDPAAELTGAAQNSALIRIEQQDGEAAIQNETVQMVVNALQERFEGLTILSTESVGAKVSGELVQAGILAVGLAVAAVLFYIWLRFEWQFALGAVAALVHDVILTIGVFSLVGLEFNLAIIAAILTIVGYSLNDTVVVFDRVRENLRRYKQMTLRDLLNLSLNETLSRTVMTSVTTLIALIALYVLGGETIRGFTFAMIWGVVVGTYSSVFVASPILLRLDVKRDWSKDGEGPTKGPRKGGTKFAHIDA